MWSWVEAGVGWVEAGLRRGRARLGGGGAGGGGGEEEGGEEEEVEQTGEAG